MPVLNSDVAIVFDEIADLLELQGANRFRIRAYRNAARTVGEMGRSVKTMLAHGEDLDALPGIGPDLAAKIAEIVTTGSCELLRRLRTEVPADLSAMLQLPHLGPQRVRALHDELGIKTLQELQRAAQDGRIRAVHGFGPKLQQQILEAIRTRLTHQRRFMLNVAEATSQSLLAHLRALPAVERAEAAGSLRRRKETIGDLDLLAQSEHGKQVVGGFVAHEDVREVRSAGTTQASVVLRNGMQVDLRVVSAASFGAAWAYFTGSKAHNIALRRQAQERGLKINEYGVFRGARRIAGADEASVYDAVGLPTIPPELREDRGEIDAAHRQQLPVLVELACLRGDLHAHTSQSDGHDSLERMALGARDKGLSYLAVTDHSARLAIAHGLDAARLAQQIDDIDRLNARLQGIVLLKGIEVDIMVDGRLDLPDSILRRLDLVVGAVHHKFDLARERQTERLLRAMDNRHFSILAHPTGRMLEEREAYDIDLARIIRKARERGCMLEVNAHPVRLDLSDTACRMAKAEGVLVCINSDAHSVLDFDNLRFGIGQARRGWLERADVANTRSLDELRPLLARTM